MCIKTLFGLRPLFRKGHLLPYKCAHLLWEDSTLFIGDGSILHAIIVLTGIHVGWSLLCNSPPDEELPTSGGL